MLRTKEKTKPFAKELETLARTHANAAWRLACVMMGNEADAEDTLQQSFVIALAKADAAPQAPLWPWFAAILTNVSRNSRRRRATRRAESFEEASMSKLTPDPASLVEKQELAAKAKAEIADLPDDLREALTLTTIGGLTHAQAAEARHVNVNTQKTQARRALQRLRESMHCSEGETVKALGAMPFVLPAFGLGDTLVEMVQSASASMAAPIASGLTTILGSKTTEVIIMSKTLIATIATVAGIAIGALGAIVITPEEPAAEAALIPKERPATSEPEMKDPGLERAERALRNRDAELKALQERFDLREGELLGALSLSKVELEKARAEASTKAQNSEAAKAVSNGMVSEHTKNLAWLQSEEFKAFTKDFRSVHERFSEILVAEATGKSLADAAYSKMYAHYRELEKTYGRPFMLMMGTLPRHSNQPLPSTLNHPGVIGPLWLQWLAEAGQPLSEDQQETIQEALSTFDHEWKKQSAAFDEETLGIEKVALEWRLKQEFQDKFLGALSDQERAKIIAPEIQGNIRYQYSSPMEILNDYFLLALDEERRLSNAKETFTNNFGDFSASGGSVDTLIQAFLNDSKPYWCIGGKSNQRSRAQIEGMIKLQVALFKELIAATDDKKQQEKIRKWDRLFSPVH